MTKPDSTEMKGVSIRLPATEKIEIEDFFLANRIKKYQEGYVQAIRLGIAQMKKIYKNG
jgi:hypothetical protein